MTGFPGKRRLAAVALLVLAGGIGVTLTAPLEPASAVDLASAKATVDAAKASGIVGEQGDGYLGYVHGSADSATTAAVDAINAGRREAYAAAAAKTGVTPDAAGQATARQLFSKLSAGEYYKPLGGDWTKK